MTSRRARAHARVTMTLDNVGPAKLLGPEQAQIRHVADTLLFCADIPNDASARAEFAGVEALLDRLVACGRWSPERAAGLGDDVWACGPGPDATLALAAWRSAASDDKAAAYAAYRAALDREAQAARTLELRLAAA